MSQAPTVWRGPAGAPLMSRFTAWRDRASFARWTELLAFALVLLLYSRVSDLYRPSLWPMSFAQTLVNLGLLVVAL